MLINVIDNYPPSQTQAVWSLGPVHNRQLTGSTFHYTLANTLNATCEGCSFSSNNFVMQAKIKPTTTQSRATSSATPSSSTSSSPRTTLRTTSHSASRTTSATSSATSSQSTAGIVGDSVDPGGAGRRSLQLGAGLGAGIPAALAIAGIFFLFLRHRRKQRQARMAGEDGSRGDDSAPLADGRSPQMRERDSRLSRESGALGPYAANPSPWEQQEERSCAEERRQAHQSRGRRRASSQRHMPFRPSLGAHSEVSDESSRHSWIDDFDFEQPYYRQADEISQIKRSIREAPRSIREAPRSIRDRLSMRSSPRQSNHTRSSRSHGSNFDVHNAPEVPQPVHIWYPDQQWHAR